MSLASRGKREQAMLQLLAHLRLRWEPGSHRLCGRRAAGALSLLEGRGLHCPLLLEGLSVAAPVQGEQLVSVGVRTAGKECTAQAVRRFRLGWDAAESQDGAQRPWASLGECLGRWQGPPITLL